MKKGKFITIEGCEGVGKSTQVALLKQYCVDNNIDAVFTREPGGTRVAEKIRDIILSQESEKIYPLTELLLYKAARAEHIEGLVLPALKQGKIVFCDRFIDSTIAYQGYGRGLNLEIIKDLNEYFLRLIDKTIFLDLSPEKGFLRKGGANKDDRMESQSKEFFEKVYNGFLTIAKQQPKRIAVVDASLAVEAVHKEIIKILKNGKIL